MDNYEKQANDFLKETNTTFRVVSYNGTKTEGNWTYDSWTVRLTRNGKNWTLPFKMGIGHKGEEPTAYDVLACVEKYDVESFEDFCDSYGYDIYNEDYDDYNKESKKIYEAVHREYNKVLEMFEDVLDKLRDIE